MQKRTIVSIVVVVLAVLSACSREDTATPDAASVTTVNSSDPLAETCASEELTATEIGVSASEITIQTMADINSPLAPGLFKGNLDGTTAFAEAVNKMGGVGCRQLVVKPWDSRLTPDEAKNGQIEACGSAVALVGGNSLFNPSVETMVGCPDKAGAATGVPNLAAAANDINEQCAPVTFVIQAVTEPCTVTTGERPLKAMVGPTKWYEQNVEPELNGLFLIPGDLPTTVQASMAQVEAQTQAGVTFDATPKVSGRAEQSAYTPFVVAAQGANATYVYNGSNDRTMVTMRKESAAQGLTGVKVWACSLACYTKPMLETGGADVEGTYLWMQFLPFEEADQNAEAQAYVDAVGADQAGSFGAQAWQAAVLFKQVVDQIVVEDGPNAITRAAILERLRATEEFTANGWLGAKDLRGISSCYVLMQIKDGRFQRVYPTEKGTFDCSPENIVTVTIDPAKQAEGLG